MQEFAVSARGLELEQSEYKTDSGAVLVSQGFPGKIVLISAEDAEQAKTIVQAQLGEHWAVERADAHLTPDPNDPSAPDPEDVLS